MVEQISDVLDARWTGSLLALSDTERAQLVARFPQLRETIGGLRRSQDQKSISQIAPNMA